MHDEQNKPITDNDERENDDVSFEEEEELSPGSIKKLREKLKIAVAEKQSYLENWQRDKAEFVNLRKRDEEAREMFLTYAKEQVLEELIPVISSFDIAFAHKGVWESVSKEWRDGVTSIYSKLQGVLEKNGLRAIDPTQGEVFNPKLHEAVVSTKTDDGKLDGTIAQVLQKGYLFNEKVLRPAQVAVYATES